MGNVKVSTLSRGSTVSLIRAQGERAFFGRRRGKPLSAHQEQLLLDVLPSYSIDINAPAPADLRGLFADPVETVALEIGFGGGEYLAAQAERTPHLGFIGVEPFRDGLAKMVSRLEAAPRGNVKLFCDDAIVLLDWLPSAALARIDQLYPDPWLKKRHWKRRFVSEVNIQRIARVLAVGGEYRFATDISHYADWTLACLISHPAFAWRARRAEDWKLPWPGFVRTRYEAKAIAAGRCPTYLAFERIGVSS